jgi:activating signal cointegrator complex subunit 1
LLHATVLNTIYVPGVKGKAGRGGGHGKRKAKLTFDASELLEDWEDFVWVSNSCASWFWVLGTNLG